MCSNDCINHKCNRRPNVLREHERKTENLRFCANAFRIDDDDDKNKKYTGNQETKREKKKRNQHTT